MHISMSNAVKKIIYNLSKVSALLILFLTHQAWAQEITTDNPLLGEKSALRMQRISAYFAQLIGFNVVSLPGVIALIVVAVLSILSILFLGLVFYGGYKWMMARGNEREVEEARAIIRQAIIGLIVLLSSYAIGYFVLYFVLTGGAGEGAPVGPTDNPF